MKKTILFTLALFSLFIFSCDPDETETTTELTTEQAKVALTQSSSDATTDIVGITSTEGIDGLRSFFNLIGDVDPFGGRSDVSHEEYRGFIKKQARLIRQIFNPKNAITGKTEDGDFGFEENIGIYDWNFVEERFVQTADSDIIVLNFPSEGSQTLNASLRITAFTEIFVAEEGGDGSYYPTRIAADLSLDDNLIIDLDATVAYSDSGDPISGNITLQLVPYTFSLVFDDSQSASASLAASISENDKIIVGVDVTVTFDSADKEEVNSISGNVQYGDLKIQGDVTVTDIDDADINDFFNLEVLHNDVKLGDIIFIEEQDDFGDLIDVPYIKYNDGTTESLEDLFEDTIIELEDFFDDLDEWGG